MKHFVIISLLIMLIFYGLYKVGCGLGACFLQDNLRNKLEALQTDGTWLTIDGTAPIYGTDPGGWTENTCKEVFYIYIREPTAFYLHHFVKQKSKLSYNKFKPVCDIAKRSYIPADYFLKMMKNVSTSTFKEDIEKDKNFTLLYKRVAQEIPNWKVGLEEEKNKIQEDIKECQRAWNWGRFLFFVALFSFIYLIYYCYTNFGFDKKDNLEETKLDLKIATVQRAINKVKASTADNKIGNIQQDIKEEFKLEAVRGLAIINGLKEAIQLITKGEAFQKLSFQKQKLVELLRDIANKKFTKR